MILTLCFNVALIARKSDGEYGETNVFGVFVFFFKKKVFASVEAKTDIVHVCTIIAVVDNTQMQDQEI